MKNVMAYTFEYGWSVSIMAPIFLFIFVFILFRTFSRSMNDRFDELSQLPLSDDEQIK